MSSPTAMCVWENEIGRIRVYMKTYITSMVSHGYMRVSGGIIYDHVSFEDGKFCMMGLLGINFIDYQENCRSTARA